MPKSTQLELTFECRELRCSRPIHHCRGDYCLERLPSKVQLHCAYFQYQLGWRWDAYPYGLVRWCTTDVRCVLGFTSPKWTRTKMEHK